MGDYARKRTKIVATLGPASRDPATLRALLRAGVDVVRLNFSHGTHAEHAATIDDVRRIAAELERPIAILQDLPGPKVRTGKLAGGVDAVLLEKGATFTLTTGDVAGTADGVSVNYPGLARDVTPGAHLYLADGALVLTILEKSESSIRTRVEVGGLLRAEQGINYPDGTLGIATVTPRDFEHLAFGLEHGIDWVAVSFVRAAEDVASVKRFMAARGANVPVMAKIEKHEALDSIDEILKVGRRPDGRARRPRHRNSARTSPARAKGSDRARQPRLEAGRHRDADARVDDRQSRGRRAPKRPTSQTPSSTEPTRSCSRPRRRAAPIRSNRCA